MPRPDIGFPLNCKPSHFRTLGAVQLLEALAAAFINTFGITQPTEATRRRAAWFILGLLILMTAAVCTIGYLFYAAMHR